MTAAILCPGPSLTKTFPGRQGDYDVKIGVNRAPIILYPLGVQCDWRSSKDWKQFTDYPAPYPLSIFTARATADDLEKHGHGGILSSVHRLFFDDLTDKYPIADMALWTLYSATAAIVLAAHLGATDIDVFGADFTNTPDADGVNVIGCDRDEARWDRERLRGRKMVEHLNGRGVRVSRILNGYS